LHRLQPRSNHEFRAHHPCSLCLFIVSRPFKIGDQPVQAFVGARYYAEKADNGPEWGVRFGLTFLFPK
jgi:hypothetical protein